MILLCWIFINRVGDIPTINLTEESLLVQHQHRRFCFEFTWQKTGTKHIKFVEMHFPFYQLSNHIAQKVKSFTKFIITWKSSIKKNHIRVTRNIILNQKHSIPFYNQSGNRNSKRQKCGSIKFKRQQAVNLWSFDQRQLWQIKE